MITPSLWILLALIALFVLCGKNIWVKLSQILDKRALKIKKDIEEALNLRQQAWAHLLEVQNLKRNAEDQAKKIKGSIHQDILNLKETTKNDLQNFLQAEHHQFLAHQKILEHEAQQKIEKILIDRAIEMTIQFIVDHPQSKMENFFITKSLEKIESYDFKFLR